MLFVGSCNPCCDGPNGGIVWDVIEGCYKQSFSDNLNDKTEAQRLWEDHNGGGGFPSSIYCIGNAGVRPADQCLLKEWETSCGTGEGSKTYTNLYNELSGYSRPSENTWSNWNTNTCNSLEWNGNANNALNHSLESPCDECTDGNQCADASEWNWNCEYASGNRAWAYDYDQAFTHVWRYTYLIMSNSKTGNYACGNQQCGGSIVYASSVRGFAFPVTNGSDLATDYSISSGVVYYRAFAPINGTYIDYTGTRMASTVLGNGYPSVGASSWADCGDGCDSPRRTCTGSFTQTTQTKSIDTIALCAYATSTPTAESLIAASATTTVSPALANTEGNTTIPASVWTTTVNSPNTHLVIGFRPDPLVDSMPASSFPGCTWYRDQRYTMPFAAMLIDRIEITHTDTSVTVIQG